MKSLTLTVILLTLAGSLAGCASEPWRVPVSYPDVAWQLPLPPAYEVCPFPERQCIVGNAIECCPAR